MNSFSKDIFCYCVSTVMYALFYDLHCQQ